MFAPKPRNYKKVNKKSIRTTYENKSNKLRFGVMGVQALEKGFLTNYQIEAIRRTITSRLKRKSKVWIRSYPDYPRTAKPKEVRMGRGKGNVNRWVAVIKPGRILFEVLNCGTSLISIREALIFSLRKFPFFVQVITKEIKI